MLLDCISASNISDYDQWLKIGIFLYCISNSEKYLELLENVSSKSKKFYDDVTRCRLEWKYFDKRGYDGDRYPNLFYYVKERYPNKFLQIFPHLNNKLLGTNYEEIVYNGNDSNIIKINTK